MYLVFTCMPGESYRRRLRSLLTCLCDVFRALINSLVCWFTNFFEIHDMLVLQRLRITIAPIFRLSNGQCGCFCCPTLQAKTNMRERVLQLQFSGVVQAFYQQELNTCHNLYWFCTNLCIEVKVKQEFVPRYRLHEIMALYATFPCLVLPFKHQ